MCAKHSVQPFSLPLVGVVLEVVVMIVGDVVVDGVLAVCVVV